MSNYSNSTYLIHPDCNRLYTLITEVYLKQAMMVLNIITSIISSIALYRIIKNVNSNGQMFKYFFIGSSVQAIATFFVIFRIGYSIGSYWWQVWFIWFYYFASDTLACIYQHMEVAASLDCLFIVNNICSYLTRIESFFIFAIFSIVLNILLNLDYILLFKIVQLSNDRFGVDLTHFSETNIHRTLNFILGFSRDLLSFILLMIINVFMLITLRKISKRKKTLKASDQASNRIHAAQLNKIIMILFTGLVFLLCHFPYMIYNLPIHQGGPFWDCYFRQSAEVFYDLGFFLQTIIYYSFNKTFKRYFKLTLTFK
jgi:hypothetical protein